MLYAASFDDVLSAAERLRGHAHHTPVARCATLDALTGRSLFFKCEHLQKVGAFKFRGAWNAVSALNPEDRARGLLTHSSGNHAQAVALTARLHNIPAWIVMPSNAPAIKREAVLGYGGQITPCDPHPDARARVAAEVQARTGATFIPSYNHPHIIAGQGTATLELLQDVPDLDALIVPIGGGGLMAGACIAARGLNPRLRIFGAEPAGADDAARSLAAGHIIPQTNPQTIADGLRTSLGDLTWPILRDHVEAILTPSEDAIRRAMRLLWERAKLPVEPSSAVALAAAFDLPPGPQRVGLLLGGGNVDLDHLPW